MKIIARILLAVALLIGLEAIRTQAPAVYAQKSPLSRVDAASGTTEAEGSSDGAQKEGTPSKSLRVPVYKPPKGIGAPGGRVGGGTRGDDSGGAELFALVPDHLGLTIKEQPSLYWYLSKSVPHKLVLTINHEKMITPVLELKLADRGAAGIHSFSLADHGLKLDVNAEYQWYVELVIDENSPARNVVAGGRIKRIVPPESLLYNLRQSEPEEKTSVYSEAGLWYDAFDSISDLIQKAGTNEKGQYVKGRVGLLQQVDLMEVAEAEEEVAYLDHSTDLYNWRQELPYTSAVANHYRAD